MSIKALILFLHLLAPDVRPEIAVLQGIEAATFSEEDAALLLTWARFESDVQVNPKPRSADAKAGKSCGPWQLPCSFVSSHPGTDEQARYWLRIRDEGARVCPEEPLAPLSGGCKRAYNLATMRRQLALDTLAKLHKQ